MTEIPIKDLTAPIETKCKGVDSANNDVFDQPIDVRLRIVEKPLFKLIESIVDCPYIRSAHQGKCKAADPNERLDIPCKYRFGITYLNRVR